MFERSSFTSTFSLWFPLLKLTDSFSKYFWFSNDFKFKLQFCRVNKDAFLEWQYVNTKENLRRRELGTGNIDITVIWFYQLSWYFESATVERL